MKPKYGGISKYMGLDKLLKTVYLLRYTYIYKRFSFVLAAQHTIEQLIFFCFVAERETAVDMVSFSSKFRELNIQWLDLFHICRKELCLILL